MRKTQVECIVFRRIGSSIQFLLLKRITSKGGFWQPPSGGLEKEDKSNLAAAFRELKEEGDIDKEDIVQVFENVYEFVVDKHYLTGEQISPIHEVVFGFEVKEDVDVSIKNNLCQEHEKMRWVKFEEAIGLLKWQNNKDAFVKINSLLQE